jgi:glycosyltransferase involved in cell wall biosynthesis
LVADSSLPELYRSATVFVMPSPNELQSMASLEAMASGLPVVAADALALPELVHEDEHGVLFPPGDACVLANRLGDLLADPARRRRMGCAGRVTAECHRFDRTLNALRTLYGELRSRS